MKQTGSLSMRNSKSNIFYQDSEPTGGTYSAGDTWFDTSSGYEMYRYTGSAWVKAGLTSAIFSTVEAGGASIGYMSSLLIFNDDDYWNLSDEDIAISGTTYAANTLRTSHLIAREDIDVQGGSGSIIRIPTNPGNSAAYAELSAGGLKNISVGSERSVYTYFPAYGEPTILESTVEYSNGTDIYTVDMEMNGLIFDHTQESSPGTITQTYNRAEYFNNYLSLYGGYQAPIVSINALLAQAQFGTASHNMTFAINGNDITKIANRYITQSGYEGAVSLRTYESTMSKYVGIGVNASSKTLYVYAGSSANSINYVGRVALT